MRARGDSQGGRVCRRDAAEPHAGRTFLFAGKQQKKMRAQGKDGLSTETAQEMQKGFRLVAPGNPRPHHCEGRDPSTSWPLRFCEAATTLTIDSTSG